MAKAFSRGGNGELGEGEEWGLEGSLSYCVKKIPWEGKAKQLLKLGGRLWSRELYICDHLRSRAGAGKGGCLLMVRRSPCIGREDSPLEEELWEHETQAETRSPRSCGQAGYSRSPAPSTWDFHPRTLSAYKGE